jgi:membrane complex biogenesis BtpA family protein
VNVFTGAAATDQGVIQGQAAEVVRERDRLCPGVEILADVHVKHARPIGGGSIAEAARDAILRGCADGVIVTGRATGAEADLADLREVREAVGGLLGKGGSGRVLVGSGLTEANAAELMALAGGAIVGTWVKQDGDVRRPVDVERVRRLRAAMDGS